MSTHDATRRAQESIRNNKGWDAGVDHISKHGVSGSAGVKVYDQGKVSVGAGASVSKDFHGGKPQGAASVATGVKLYEKGNVSIGAKGHVSKDFHGGKPQAGGDIGVRIKYWWLLYMQEDHRLYIDYRLYTRYYTIEKLYPLVITNIVGPNVSEYDSVKGCMVTYARMNVYSAEKSVHFQHRGWLSVITVTLPGRAQVDALQKLAVNKQNKTKVGKGSSFQHR